MRKNVKCLLMAASVVLSAMLSTSCGVKVRPDSTKYTMEMGSRPFERIDIDAACEVEYVQSDTYSLRMEGDELVKHLLVDSDGTTLRIRFDTPEHGHVKGKQLPKISVSSPDLVSVLMRGAGKFEVESPLDTDTLRIDMPGAGKIEFDQVVCDRLDISLSGAGKVEVDNVTTQQAYIKQSGVGKTEVNFVNSGDVKALLTGVGEIELSGSARSLEEQNQGAGRIKSSSLRCDTRR